MTDKAILIGIPTYNRKWPSILNCIRANSDLAFYMFVRKDEYENGYYDEPQFQIQNLQFLPMTNIRDVGLVREAMLQYAISNGYRYCFQIDDTQFGLHDIDDKYLTLSEILSSCVYQLENDKFKSIAFAMNFSRTVNSKTGYFDAELSQTYLLNCDICKQYDLHFKHSKDVGFEDLAFTVDAVAKGLVELTSKQFIRIGRKECVADEGGCHANKLNANYYSMNMQKVDILKNYVFSNINDRQLIAFFKSKLYDGLYVKLNRDYIRKKLIDGNLQIERQ